jgi:Mg-chelatase subunit ChlI
MAVVYEHLRNDTNEVFYVGIGEEEKRAYVKANRNPHWKNITNKIGYTVNVKINDATWDEAIQIEKYLIAFYGRKDLGLGSLVNMTDGGDGCNNPSIETRKKMSELAKDRTHTEESKQKMSQIHKGKTKSEETKQKMSERQKGKTPMLGKTHSNETKQKTSEAMKGKKQSPEHIANSIASRKGMKYNKSKI